MLSLWLVAAALCVPSKAADRPPFQMLSEVAAAAKNTEGTGREQLEKELDAAKAEASALAPEKRDEAVERHIGAINEAGEKVDAAASPAAARRLNVVLAKLNNSAERHQDALRFSDRALAMEPADRDALISRSAANLGLSRFDAAYEDADLAVHQAPDDAAARRARALASYKRHDYLKAQEDARRALALDPADRTSYAIMQLSQSKVPSLKLGGSQPFAGEVEREYHGMVQQLNQAAERAQEPAPQPLPQNVLALVRAAAAKIQIKDYYGAIADSTRALEHDPDNAEAFYFRAAAENLVGRYEDAAADATRAILLSPGDPAPRDTRAWAYNNLGRFRDAISDSHHSLEVNPRDAYAFSNLAFAHERQGDIDSMLRAYRAAAALNGQFEPAYRDAAARHGLEPDFGGKETPAPSARQKRRRSFAVVVVSSVIGGLLIALGFIHLYGETKNPAPASRIPDLPALSANYSLGQQIASGGMGVVYEAFDKTLERRVAVKIMRPEFSADPKSRERSLHEARTVAALHHPAIVDIHAIVNDAAGLCLVFEHIEGRTLEDILGERGRLSLSQARSLLKPVCQGLEFAHRHGVVHRDLKPGNIMVTSSGQVKIMDFGISRHEGAASSGMAGLEKATARGTPYYMAPEQEHGEVRHESDIFSLGACLYEMVTGSRPYPGPYSFTRKLERAYDAPSKVLASLPPKLDELIAAALHPDPHERIRSASEFLALLERLDDARVPA